jgi:hypothetical protein
VVQAAIPAHGFLLDGFDESIFAVHVAVDVRGKPPCQIGFQFAILRRDLGVVAQGRDAKLRIADWDTIRDLAYEGRGGRPS